ncbi:MAG: isocitrate lyase/PEP mutase family protein [Desulfovibrio sp.]
MHQPSQIERAKAFTALHKSNELFVLPNAWDGGSAKIFQAQGFKAVATTSAGIAYSMGYADGEVVSFADLHRVTKEMVKRLSVPLSVDMELGYGDSSEAIIHNVRQIIEAGAVGINIEDGHPADDLSHSQPFLEEQSNRTELIKALTQLKKEMGIPFIINARTCAMWLHVGPEEKRLQLAMARCKAYAEAGADCVFVPGALSVEEVHTLVNCVDIPVNIIANPLCNDFEVLNKLGVRRLSIGSGAVRAVYAKLMGIAKELDEDKSIKSLLESNLSYAQANQFFGK